MIDETGAEVEADKAFVFHDGTKVRTLAGLLERLENMAEEDVRRFVSEEKHDFAAWIVHCFQDNALADKVAQAKDREALIKVLHHHLQGGDPFEDYQSEVREIGAKKKPQPAKVSAPTAGIDDSAVKGEGDEEKESAEEEAPGRVSTIDPTEIMSEERGSHQAPKETQITEEQAQHYARRVDILRKEISKVFIGQTEVVRKVLLALMCDAHCLLEGVPGLAKSLLVETLSRTVEGTTFSRIQFLPDLLPADVIGGQIYNPKTATFSTIKGPIFANFVLADEINRAPPKTHAALMEAMQEKKINIDVEEYNLDRPFLVLATQNPLENKGTYALPEAVLDRFMFKIDLPYPSRKDEIRIITQNATTMAQLKESLRKVITKDEFLEMQSKVREVYISDAIRAYILDLVEATRGLNPKIEGRHFIQYGGGPRASIYLGVGAKAQAVIRGRNYVLPEDINYVSPDILRHRVALNFKGKAHNVSSDKIVEEILTKVHAL